MTTSPTAVVDPHTVPAPGPETPVVLPQWIRSGNQHPNSRYRDAVWSLAPLIDNPSTSLVTVSWERCPEELRGPLKQLAWAMINGQLRATFLQARGSAARARRSAQSMWDTCYEWMRFASWLHEHGMTDLRACTDQEWYAYAIHQGSQGYSHAHVLKALRRLTDLWIFDQHMAHPLGLRRPPWEAEGSTRDFLAVSQAAGGENATEPLDPEVVAPLLAWAMRMVEDFAEDILAAWAENRRLTSLAKTILPSPEGRADLEAYLLPFLASGAGIPSTRHQGKHRLARTFLAATTGASLRQVDEFGRKHELTALAAQHPGPCPVPVTVTGQINGRPWREHMDFNEASILMRHLGTAAALICLYLTGMRPQEIQGLRSGCCPDPAPASEGTPGQHLIRGRHYKNVTDDEGNHVSAGEEREVPWVAITPVVNAIRALERMVPEGELLFSATHHDFRLGRDHGGAMKKNSLKKRIEDFITWANHEARTHGLNEQSIPNDPHGTVSPARFRRSLAWHIARRPGGLVALAIQYGHMRTVLDARSSSGYASRSRGGIHSVLDVETALASAETAAQLRDRAAAGEKISGPAARRALTTAATTPRFEGRTVTPGFAKKAAQFLSRDGTVLYDNPEASLICAFKRENALCEPAPGATAPRQYACKPGCGNTVRTDAHAQHLRQRAEQIDQLATRAPDPVARRLRTNADRLRADADAHDATAQTAQDAT